MLNIVTWLWNDNPDQQCRYAPHHVNALRLMFKKYLHLDHTFICITNNQKGLHPDIKRIPHWPNPVIVYPAGRPNCFRRLRAFAANMTDILGEQFVSIDLDCLLLDDVTPLFDRGEDFIIWQDPILPNQYNGGLWMLRSGTRVQVWNSFHPDDALVAIKQNKLMGSDQAWITYVLGPNEPTWTEEDGIYSYRKHIMVDGLRTNTRMIFFHGRHKPWDHLEHHEYLSNEYMQYMKDAVV